MLGCSQNQTAIPRTVKKTATSPSTSKPIPTELQVFQASMGKVINDGLNIRIGPGTQYQILDSFGKGETFYLLDERVNADTKHHWLLVLFGHNSIGWVIGEPKYVEEYSINVDATTMDDIEEAKVIANNQYSFNSAGIMIVNDISKNKNPPIDNINTPSFIQITSTKISPTFTRIIPSKTPIPPTRTRIPPTSKPSISPCSQAVIGTNTTCYLKPAYCSYQPSVSGSPTFCNDAPYGSHHFIFVAWEEDLSYLDGSCLIISGYVDSYKGLPEIKGSTYSVQYCN